MNSGGSPVNVSSGDPHHPALYGFDVYRVPDDRLRSIAPLPANTPAPQLVLSKTGMAIRTAPSRHRTTSTCG